MKHSLFILLSIIFLLGDLAMQIFVPGFSWLMPLWLTVCAIMSNRLSEEIPYLVGGAVVYDVVSGLPLGLFTIAYLVILATIGVVSRWIAINRSSFPSLILPSYLANVWLVVCIFFGYAIGTI